MACDHDWTIKFLDVNDGDPFEVRPISMSLKQSRKKYDFCRATLPWEVGEEMKPHTRYEGGALYGRTPVDVCYNDIPMQRLMFRPDWVDYGSENTHLELHDLQKALADGFVDIQKDTVQLKQIYRTVVEKATNRLIDEIHFTLPDQQIRTLYGERSSSGRGGHYRKQAAERDNTKKVVEGNYAIDFDQISPENAIAKLNKKFKLKTWIDREGVMMVGLPEANSIRHVAASDDERVWRYKDPQISHGREPIQNIRVEGAWVDDPGLDLDPAGWFNEGGTADLIATGFASRTDIDYGTTISVSSTGAKRDALPHIARLALREKMKEQNAGTVEIDPELSGEEVSEVLDLTTGDLLHIVPEDDWFKNPTATSGEIGDPPEDLDKVCGGFINNEVYLVSEVEHNVSDSGEWQVYADIGMYHEGDVEAFVRYFDPEDEGYLSEEEVFDGNWIEDDGDTLF